MSNATDNDIGLVKSYITGQIKTARARAKAWSERFAADPGREAGNISAAIAAGAAVNVFTQFENTINGGATIVQLHEMAIRTTVSRAVRPEHSSSQSSNLLAAAETVVYAQVAESLAVYVRA